MRILVAGGTGLLGRPLCHSLAVDGHDVIVLSRSETPRAFSHPGITPAVWHPDGSAGSVTAIVDGADAVINLAGDSIGEGRWTTRRKRELVDSRVRSTRTLAAGITGVARPPGVFINASAVGYYGATGGEPLTEAASAGTDFLARLCVEWEAAAQAAEPSGIRLVRLRSGVVLTPTGGALGKLLPPFKLGLGGPAGSGRQYWSWIHVDDWVSLVRWLLATPTARGPVNATAPNPVTNKDMARTLGRALKRPAVLPAPGPALKLLLGAERADALLLTGQRAVPALATRLGFTYRYAALDRALAAILAA